MRRFILLPIVVVTFVVGVSACGKSAPAPAGTQAGAAKPATGTPDANAAPTPPKPVPAQLPDVIARVNGTAIDRAEFENAIRSVEGQAGGPVPAERRDEVYRGVLDQLVGFHLLEQESTARHVSVSEADVEVRIAEMRKQFPNEDAFKNALAAQKMTPEQLREQTRTRIAINRVLDAEVLSKVAVQPQEIDEYYAKNPARFKEPETVRASHILIVTPPAADDAAKKKARGTADALLGRLKKGADFAKLARENSQDTGTAANGGELPPIARGSMLPEFEAAAFSLKPGDLGGPVQTQYGFHLIKVHDKRPARTVPLDEVRDQVSQFLTEQKRSEKTAAFVADLKAKGKVEILI
jgi:peptidyl-prolyl cis-trans isomerase C